MQEESYSLYTSVVVYNGLCWACEAEQDSFALLVHIGCSCLWNNSRKYNCLLWLCPFLMFASASFLLPLSWQSWIEYFGKECKSLNRFEFLRKILLYSWRNSDVDGRMHCVDVVVLAATQPQLLVEKCQE